MAELGAVILMRHFGMLNLGTAIHAKYFQIWLERAGDRPAALRHAVRNAKRAVVYILEHGTSAKTDKS